MFCKTTYCALLLMMEMALVYDSGKGVDLDSVSRKHAIPSEAFNEIIGRLKEMKYLAIIGGKLCLQMPPDKITIWQIVIDAAGDNIFAGRYFDQANPVTPTSAMIMLHKE